MGYCWTSGHQVDGKWKFTKCNGNKSRGPGNCCPESMKENPRCMDCHEWCSTLAKAKRIIIEYIKTNKE